MDHLQVLQNNAARVKLDLLCFNSSADQALSRPTTNGNLFSFDENIIAALQFINTWMVWLTMI